MRFANILIISLIALLSVAAGLAKVMQTEQEMEFLQSFGLSGAAIIAFGMIQVAGGVLLVPPKTRMLGLVLATSAFAASSLMILVSGNWVFALLSTIPIILACVIVYLSARIKHTK